MSSDMNSSESTPTRQSILSVINDNSSRSVDALEILSDKVDSLFADIQKLSTQNAENYNLIIKLFQDFSAPPAVRSRKTTVAK